MIRREKIYLNTNKLNQKKSSENKSFAILVINILIISISAYLVYSIFTKFYSAHQKETDVKEILDRVPTVEVLNGCGYSGIADKFTDLIRSKNFDVVKTGNYYTFDVDTTFIIDRVGNKKYALALADSLKIPAMNVIQHYNKNYFLDVTFVIGKDFNNYLKR